MRTGVFSSSRMLMTSVPHRRLLSERPVAGRDDPVRRVGQGVGGDDGEAALPEDTAAFLDVRAGEPHDEGHRDRDLPHRLHHALRHPVAAVDAGEHVHEDRVHLAVGEDQPKGGGDAVGARSPPDVEEVGRLAPRVLDHVHRGHREPGAVDDAADIAVKEAVSATGATASLLLVPAPYCADAIMEAADAGIQLVVTITDGVPAQDMMTVKRYLWRYAKERRTRLIGPNCAGVISAGKAMMGIMPGHIYQRGRVGVVTRSGTLGYEAASQMSALGVGISTSVGIGGDPINGSSFVDMLVHFEQDPETDAVMMIGEIGGPQEAGAATCATG